MSNYHNRVMNIKPVYTDSQDMGYEDREEAYKDGHRDARHAASREVKEILDIEIENTDTNRYLRGKIDLLKEENDYLNKTLKKCQDMSVMGHVKIIFNKIFKGV